MTTAETRVLYLSYDGMTDPLGQSQVIPYLQGLRKQGYCFTILSFEKALHYRKQKQKITELLDHSDITWIPVKYHKSPPVLSTLFDLLLMYLKVKRLHSKNAFHIIHCRSYLCALIGSRMKRKYNTKLLFDMRGFWADERVEANLWNINNPIYRGIYQYFKKKEVQFLEEADYTVCLTNSAKQEILQWKRVRNNPIPIKVIPCCADLQHFSRDRVLKQDFERAQTQTRVSENDFVLVYLGSLGTWYMVEEMLAFFKVLLSRRANAKFLILSKDVHVHLLPYLKALGIPEERVILTSVTRQEVPAYLKLAKVAIFFIKPVYSKKASSPTKQGEIMGMGIPIVCNAGVGDTAEIIQASKSGVIVDNFSEEHYHLVCNNLKELLSLSTSTIRESAQQYYSLASGINSYKTVYEKIL